MWELANIICTNIVMFTGFFVMKKSKKGNNIQCNLKNILILLFGSIIVSFITTSEYQIVTPIFSCFISIIIYKIIFNLNISESTIMVGTFYIIIFLSELILSPIIFLLFPNGESRLIPSIMILSNVAIGITTYCISQISYVSNIFNKLIIKVKNTKLQKTILFIILTITIISIIFSLIAEMYDLSRENIIYILSIGIFVILFIIYSKEQNEYVTLVEKYDQLLDYVTEFEQWTDKVELEKHEYKNDLAVLGTKVHDKEIKKFIEEKLTKKLLIDENWGLSLKEMPSGGMKGLLYYKIIFAKNNHINLRIDISKNIRKYFKVIPKEEYRILCHLFGIYLDNALEASLQSKEKSMSVEIYELQNKLNIVISNSFSGKLELSKLNEKGYTSKGINHGKGLYFANEILKQTNMIKVKNQICNNYYIQKLEIYTK